MSNLLYNWAVNDLGYVVAINENYGKENGKRLQKSVWKCPYYNRYVTMLKRCFGKNYKDQNKSYSLTGVCGEWKSAKAFKAWMEKQDWQDKHLDKDLLGDGTLYSPETCCFVLPETNKFLTDSAATRGEYLLGVSLNKSGKFVAQCRNIITGKNEHLGVFDSELEAHLAWKNAKHSYAVILAEKESDLRVKEALVKRYSGNQPFIPHKER